MPVYKNIGNIPINLDNDNVVINPGETKTVYHYYNNPNLQLLDVKPYLTPYKYSNIVTVDSSTPFEYEVIDNSFVIIPLNGHIKIHFNEYPCENPAIQISGSHSYFDNQKNSIYKIFIEPFGSDSTDVFISVYDKEFNMF
jgi:archaellin